MRLIDADVLKNDVYNSNDICIIGNYIELMSKESIYKLVDIVETVDAEPVRHGKWLYGTEYAGTHEVDCSVCGDNAKEYFDYCPNCGAKMDLEE